MAIIKEQPTTRRTVGIRSASGVWGFSMVEVLMAMAILLLVVVGVLPVFTRSMLDNVQGAQATKIAALARAKIEELDQLSFDSPALTLPGGRSERVTIEYYCQRRKDWVAESDWDDGEVARFTRRVRIRQFSLDGLRDNQRFDDEEALPGGTSRRLVHLKEIEVVVATPAQIGVFGPQRRIRLQVYKPF